MTQAIPVQAPHDVGEGGRDRLGRPLHDLRISVTDRCNFRCTYCMPKELFGASYRFMPRSELLSFEEITRLASVFAGHGVRKIRLTGGSRFFARISMISSGCCPRSRGSKT